jgi:hypothetical protein
MKRRGLLAVMLTFAACASGPPPPARLDTRSDTCRNCRMVVSDIHFAAQIVADGEEPAFFDDLGCLHAYLGRQGGRARGAVIYVADHRTGAWAPAASAAYTRLAGVETPMGGGMAAHADEASRKSDPVTAGGTNLPAAAVIGEQGEHR